MNAVWAIEFESPHGREFGAVCARVGEFMKPAAVRPIVVIALVGAVSAPAHAVAARRMPEEDTSTTTTVIDSDGDGTIDRRVVTISPL